jgi:hypothetical protein
MPDELQQPTDPAPARAEAEPSRLQARRRLARAGLAAPIVLGTLFSKPVLGQVPRNCTMSGQVSGNMSSPGDGNCAELGNTPEYWASNTSLWPTGIDPGFKPKANCKFESESPAGTRFNAVFGDSFRYKNGTSEGGICKVFALGETGYPTDGSSGSATLLQVLLLPAQSTFNLKRLGRAAVASLLNASDPSVTDYPLSPAQVISMFNQVRLPAGKYWVNSTMGWDMAQVTFYFESLWGARNEG